MLPDEKPERTLEAIKMVFEGFQEYSRLLRTWLVAFGIGGPILFFNTQDVYQKLIASSNKWLLLTVFLVGLGLQVLSALLHKWISWFLVVGAFVDRVKHSSPYRFSAYMTGVPWVGVIADVGAVVLFAWATVLSIDILI